MEVLMIILSVILFFTLFLGFAYVRVQNRLEYIKSSKNPEYFIETYLKVFDREQKKKVRFKLTDFQRNLLDDIINDRYVEFSKVRDCGVSSLLTAYITWIIVFNSNKKIGIVQQNIDRYLLDQVEEHISNLPKNFRKFKPLKNKSNSCNSRFSNDCEVRILYCKAVPPKAHRFDYVIWDGYIENYDKYLSSLKKYLYNGSRLVVSKEFY